MRGLFGEIKYLPKRIFGLVNYFCSFDWFSECFIVAEDVLYASDC